MATARSPDSPTMPDDATLSSSGASSAAEPTCQRADVDAKQGASPTLNGVIHDGSERAAASEGTSRRWRLGGGGKKRGATNSTSSSSSSSTSSSEPFSVLEMTSSGTEEGETDRSVNLSFAGCGFLGIYHLGVASTLQQHGRGFLADVRRFSGASAGALVASVLAIRGEDTQLMQDCLDFTYSLARNVQKHRLGLLTPGLSLLDSLQEFLGEQLPEDAHLVATDRLYISMTTSRKKKNIIVSQYTSKQDLIQCLLATSYVPHITGKKPVVRNGKKYIDGGLSDNLPILSTGRTVCVSPFSGRYDICPVDTAGANRHVNVNKQDFQVNLQNLVRGLHAFFPPRPSQLEAYFHKGRRDAIRFLRREGHYEGEEAEEEEETPGKGTSDSSQSKPTGPNADHTATASAAESSVPHLYSRDNSSSSAAASWATAEQMDSKEASLEASCSPVPGTSSSQTDDQVDFGNSMQYETHL